MNKNIEVYIRSEIKSKLRECSDAQFLVFKKMYHHWNLNVGIDEAVDAVPVDKLDSLFCLALQVVGKVLYLGIFLDCSYRLLERSLSMVVKELRKIGLEWSSNSTLHFHG